MKQYITTGQLNELSREEKSRLTKWWRPQDGDRYVFINDFTGNAEDEIQFITSNASDDEGGWEELEKETKDYVYIYDGKEQWRKQTAPLLSIGQMIEFLMNIKKLGDNFSYIEDGELYPVSGLYFSKDNFDENQGIIFGDAKYKINQFFLDEDLTCDNLWEAVKSTIDEL